MNPAEAASTVRFHHQWMPDELRVEKASRPTRCTCCAKKARTWCVKPAMGRTQTIQVHGQALWGYSDPRNPDGLTLGY